MESLIEVDIVTSTVIPEFIIKTDVRKWLEEDIPYLDLTSRLVPDKHALAHIIAKQDGVICGTEIARLVFSETGVTSIMPKIHDGGLVNKGDTVIELQGNAKNILLGERVALNILGHLSGIATQTRRLVQKLLDNGLETRIAATRKTLPGLRRYEKYAVEVGGGDTHRLSLSDMVLLKENHLAEFPSITKALEVVRDKLSFSKKIEIEVKNEDEAFEAATTHIPDVIMLDNFSPKETEKIIPRLKDLYPDVLIEASGGITPQNVIEYAKAGVDIISMGYLTHSVKNFDLSLLIRD
ncbi:MAG: carboxylating nicotinate-nucleotide diphosphorylase [Methanobacteriota archaeon]|nr:MAG: carboxylating nicotinate-nucleotide diphosphorylase [Euryarchaeota archaeon]